MPRRFYLSLLAAFIPLIILRGVLLAPELDAVWKLAALILSSLIFLAAAVTALTLAYRQRLKVSFRLALFGLAFLPALIAFFFPVFRQRTPIYNFAYVWMGVFLTWARFVPPAPALVLLPPGARRPESRRQSLLIESGVGLLGGMFLYLVCAFVLSIESRLAGAGLPPLPRTTPPGMTLLPFYLSALLLVPLGAECAFRGELHAWFESRPPRRWMPAALSSTLMFAGFRLNFFLFLPALLFGAGAWDLTRRRQCLFPAILAHAVFNLLMLLGGWDLAM